MLSLSNLISQTWLLYFRNFKTYLKLSFWIFLFTIPTAGLSLLLDSLRQTRIINLFLSIIINLAVFILTVLIIIVLVRVADKQSSSQTEERQPLSLSIKDEFKHAFHIWFEVLLISIVIALIQLGGFLLLIVPGIIFSVWFAFSIYIVILEGAKIKESLSKSRELVRNRFWGVLLRIFIPTILWSLFGWAVTIIFINLTDLIQKYLLANIDGAMSYIINFVKLLGSTYINALFIPLFVISMVILFRNLQKTE